MNIRWQDKIPDTTVLDRSGIPSIDTILMQTQIRWAGHLVCMPDHRLPKILLYGELEKGKRSQGGQKKRYKDLLKTSLKAFEIDQNTWEKLVQNRSTWRSTVKKSASSCEKRRNAATQQRRVDRKSRI